MLAKSLEVTQTAMLSRAVAGIRRKTLVITLPGSRKAAVECVGFLQSALPHALDLLADRVGKVAATHRHIQHTVVSTLGQHPAHRCSHHHTESSQFLDQPATSAVADRPRISQHRMLPMSEATEVVLQASSVLDVINIPLAEALGHVLATTARALVPQPPFPASIKDGYAVIASDCPGVLEVLAPVTAGAANAQDLHVRPGTAVRITTGAPVPKGADAVVQVEDTDLVEKSSDGQEEKSVRMRGSVTPGQDVRPVGCDIEQNQEVLLAGHLLGPADLGMLASIGCTSINVYRKPRVALFSSGDEIVDVASSAKLRFGQIWDSNRPSLLAALQMEGCKAFDLGIIHDDRDALRTALAKALDFDAIVTSGGVSMGWW